MWNEELLKGSVICTDKASRLLEVFDDLNSFSDTVRNSLTDEAKAGFDELWLNWSVQLLDMARYLEDVGILLNNATALYMSQDLEVAKAFGLDPTQAKEIYSEIDAIKNENDAFQKKFDEDVKKVEDVKKKAEDDKNVDPVVDVSPSGDKIYESKEHPGDRYEKRDDEEGKGQWAYLARTSQI